MSRKKTNKKAELKVLAVIALGIAAFGLAPAWAQTIAPSPCDSQYYDSLKSRAWLEAQREITQNQNLIFKPDSVMEYTCFDQFMKVLAEHGVTMFSENEDRWGSVPGVDSQSLDFALQDLVGNALINYVSANYSHDLLGGRAQGLNYTPTSVVGGGSYGCGIMNQVWQVAKCWNFVSDVNEDGFYTFAQYAADPDKRFKPTRCTGTGEWTPNITAAEGTGLWNMDNVVTYFNLLNPANCATSIPVATGITITRPHQSPTTYEEKFCIPPGCHYNPSSGTCSGS